MSSTKPGSAWKRRLILFELTTLIILYGVIVWVLVPNVFTSSIAFYLLFILAGSAIAYFLFISPLLFHEDTLEGRGLGPRNSFYIRTDNFYRALSILLVPVIMISTIIIVAAWQNGSAFFVRPDWYAFSLKFSMYLFSAFAQDIFFFSFILVRLKDIITIDSETHKNIVVILLFSLLFTLFHLPNIPLMVLSFLFAIALGQLFYKVPNLHVVIIIHAILGTLLHRVYELHMKMGVFYGMESQQGYLMRYLLPIFDELIGNRW